MFIPVPGTRYILTMVPGLCEASIDALIGAKQWKRPPVPPGALLKRIAAMSKPIESGVAKVYLELGDAGINGVLSVKRLL